MINIDYKKETFLSGSQWQCIVAGQIIGFIELSKSGNYLSSLLYEDIPFASVKTLTEAKNAMADRFGQWLETIDKTER